MDDLGVPLVLETPIYHLQMLEFPLPAMLVFFFGGGGGWGEVFVTGAAACGKKASKAARRWA